MATADARDRTAELKAFDDTKSGVKGLVDAGVTSVPAIFRHPVPSSPSPPPPPHPPHVSVPVIDLSLPRTAAVAAVRSAASTWGFFQLVNHGVPLSVLSAALSAARSFHELPADERARYYLRNSSSGVSYFSNVDLFRSSAASWRDTLQIAGTAAAANPDRIPAVCRDELVEWDRHVRDVAKLVTELLCEGIGAAPSRLDETSCLEMRVTVAHYYPTCPEPDVTEGIAAHTDPSVLTVLVQDKVGGLQVEWKGDDGAAEAWVDVEPVPGGLVVNIGDLLQIISNNEYKSTVHRVVANSRPEARVSIATFFNPGKRGEGDLYGPLDELASAEKPAVYRKFTISEYLGTFFSRHLSSKVLVDHFKI